MNLDYLKKCAERQHKATGVIVQSLVGVSAALIASYPLIAKKGTVLYYFAPTQAKIDSDLINPYILNGSFSLELHMKYLHAFETGEKLAGGHRLWELFSGLTEHSQNSVQRNFSSITKASALHKQISRKFNQELKLPFTWNLELLLKRADLAFERWRYIYEGEDTTWFAGYSEIQLAIWRRVLQLDAAKSSGSASGHAP